MLALSNDLLALIMAAIQGPELAAASAVCSIDSDGFVLYGCDHCDYLCAVRVGEDAGVEHVCECCE